MVVLVRIDLAVRLAGFAAVDFGQAEPESVFLAHDGRRAASAGRQAVFQLLGLGGAGQQSLLQFGPLPVLEMGHLQLVEQRRHAAVEEGRQRRVADQPRQIAGRQAHRTPLLGLVRAAQWQSGQPGIQRRKGRQGIDVGTVAARRVRVSDGRQVVVTGRSAIFCEFEIENCYFI